MVFFFVMLIYFHDSEMRDLLFFFKFYFYYLFIIYFWLCWVFVSVRGLSLVVASGGHSSSRCVGLSLSLPLLLWSTGSRRAGSVVVAHDPVAPRHVGSSQTRGRARVPCIGRQALNRCTTREARYCTFYHGFRFCQKPFLY